MKFVSFEPLGFLMLLFTMNCATNLKAKPYVIRSYTLSSDKIFRYFEFKKPLQMVFKTDFFRGHMPTAGNAAKVTHRFDYHAHIWSKALLAHSQRFKSPAKDDDILDDLYGELYLKNW